MLGRNRPWWDETTLPLGQAPVLKSSSLGERTKTTYFCRRSLALRLVAWGARLLGPVVGGERSGAGVQSAHTSSALPTREFDYWTNGFYQTVLKPPSKRQRLTGTLRCAILNDSFEVDGRRNVIGTPSTEWHLPPMESEVLFLGMGLFTIVSISYVDEYSAGRLDQENTVSDALSVSRWKASLHRSQLQW